MERRDLKPVADHAPADLPLPRAGQVAAEYIFDQLARSRVGQGFALVRPVLERDKAPCLRAVRVEPPELGELAHRPLRVERPKGGLEHFHRKRSEFLASRLGMAP